MSYFEHWPGSFRAERDVCALGTHGVTVPTARASDVQEYASASHLSLSLFLSTARPPFKFVEVKWHTPPHRTDYRPRKTTSMCVFCIHPSVHYEPHAARYITGADFGGKRGFLQVSRPFQEERPTNCVSQREFFAIISPFSFSIRARGRRESGGRKFRQTN